tara:strand:+ start:2343 stop:3392 length:1050 start_codon:yes stop_codon:yes gene_type:complete
MRYLKRIIEQVRKQTENEDVSDFVGIQDSEFVQYINDAQHRLQGLIAAQHPRVFLDEHIIDITSGTESYDLPTDTFLNNKVHNVEYSSTGNNDDYYTLEQTTLKRRNSGITGSPSHYIRMAGKVLLSPQPTGSGKLRITYVKKVKELDLRRAQVHYKDANGTEVTNSISTSQRWKIHLDYAAFTTEIDSLREHDYISVVDAEGKSIVKNIKVASEGACLLNFETRTTKSNCENAGGTWETSGVQNTYIVCEPHTIDTNAGETATSIPEGAYLIGGRDSSSHSELPRSVERYLIAYCSWKILKRDSSVDSAEAQVELAALAQEIINSYALISDDVQFIPQLNSWDDWSLS